MSSTPPYGNVKTLLDFFQAHPNRTFSGEHICQVTGIPKGSLHGTFMVLSKSNPEVVKLSRGMYRYRESSTARKVEPAQEPLPSTPVPPVIATVEPGWPEKLSVIGPTSSGELIVQSDTGELYLARRL